MSTLGTFFLVLFCACAGIHLGVSMQFPTVSLLGGCAPVLLRYLPFRPIAPTPGLTFILLSVGGLGGYFSLVDIAAPGTWPAYFSVLGGICVAALVLMNWMLAAGVAEDGSAPVDRLTQNILLTGLLLLLLTPYPSQGRAEPWISHGIAWLQLTGLVAVALSLTLGRLSYGWGHRASLLLPLLVLAPASYYGLQFLQGPLVRGLVQLAPNFSGGRTGFSPIQFLDHRAFLTPSMRPVLRIQADVLPGPYLVGNRMVTMNGSSMSWDAGKQAPLRGESSGTDATERPIFTVPNHHFSGDSVRDDWWMKINSVRWDRLVFFPPGTHRIGVSAQHLVQNQHRVWKAEFDTNARKEWLASGGVSRPDNADRKYLQLPTFWDEKLQTKALSMGRENREKTVAAILAEYYRRGYTLEVEFNARRPFHDFFLGESPAYCFWFATGAALALRANDVPARLVSGYLITERIGPGQWLVRERDAHSWVEWQDQHGFWHTMDPTPPDFGNYFTDMRGSRWSRYYHRFVLWWQNRVDSIRIGEQQENILIIIGFLVLVFLFVREYLRIRAAQAEPANLYSKQWRRVWGRFLSAAGLNDTRHWSASQYADNLPTAWGEPKKERARQFLALYGRYRFSPEAPPFAEMETLIKDFKKEK